jgi:hypothetical protein
MSSTKCDYDYCRQEDKKKYHKDSKPTKYDYYSCEEEDQYRKDYKEKKDDCNLYEEDHRYPDHNDKKIQTHVHEFAGSEMIAGKIPHNHRFAGVTSEKIPYGKSHVHAILTNDDFFYNHHHEVGVKTGPAIDVGHGKHIHFVKGETTKNFGHHHDFIFTTFIENPLQKKYCK